MDSVLRVAATTIGRLTGKTPREAQIVYQAMNTPSVSKPGKNMYRGLRTDDIVSVADGRVLLENHGIGTVRITYDATESENALRTLRDALVDPSKVVIASLDGRHVVVTDLNEKAHSIWLDDSTWSVEDVTTDRPEPAVRQMSLDEFVSSWSAAEFELIVGELTRQVVPPPATWSILRPRRESARHADLRE